MLHVTVGKLQEKITQAKYSKYKWVGKVGKVFCKEI